MAAGGLVAKGQPGDNAAPLTITEISQLLKRTVEDRFGFVRLRGELSGVKRAASGHLYCCLKDEGAVIDGVMWRGSVQRLSFLPEDGIEVVAGGKLTTYPGRSKYQIVIETMEIAGEGALLALLDKTRRRLEAEGLFDASRKRPLPFLPGVIGVVTSPTGAVIRDILHRLGDRFPSRVLVWPVLVQGQGAAEQVAAALRGFAAIAPGGPVPRPDLLIVARGGGSIEDLWAFNEEIVVRAIADSPIPVISAVGHETDTTLADFAADRRAPTPTAAAEMAVPVRAELLTRLAALGARQVACWQRGLEHRRKELRALERALPKRERLFEHQRQRLDMLAERLPRALRANAQVHHRQLDRVAARLAPQLLRGRIERCVERIGVLGGRARRSARVYLAQRAALLHRVDFDHRAARAFAVCHERRAVQLARAGELLKAFSYRGVLARGFALVRDDRGRPLRSAAAVAAGARLEIEFADGRRGAIADGATEVAAPSARPPVRPKRKPASDQGDLF